MATPSTSDPRHGPAISREGEDDEKEGSGGFEKREKESREPEGEQEQDCVQVAAPLTSANVAKAPMVAGRKRSNPAVQKGTNYQFFASVSHGLLNRK